MKIAVFHGSPRRGNTYRATKIFLEALHECGRVELTEFFLPAALPTLCTGCTLCLGGKACPHAEYVQPIVDQILSADALLFATPHYGACSMTGSMKNLLDHLDFLVLNVSPRREMFEKKAFIITTAAGSAAAIKPIKKYLIDWGVNRVHALGLRLLTDKWDNMPAKKQARFEAKLRRAAKKFYRAKKGRPYLSAIFMYYMSKFIIKRYVGEGSYPYEYWRKMGYFESRPF